MNSQKSPHTIRYLSAEELQAQREKIIRKNAIDASAILEGLTDKPHEKLTEKEVDEIIAGATQQQQEAYRALLLARACEDAVVDDLGKQNNYKIQDDSGAPYSSHSRGPRINQLDRADVTPMTNRAANVSA